MMNFNLLPRDCSSDILVMKVGAICPCPKSLHKAILESFVLISFVKEISKQPSIYSAMEFLVVTKICIGKEETEQGIL